MGLVGVEVAMRRIHTHTSKLLTWTADDLPDVVFANRTGNPKPNALKDPGYNFICFNKGAGQFVDDCLTFSGESATTVTPADFDGYGDGEEVNARTDPTDGSVPGPVAQALAAEAVGWHPLRSILRERQAIMVGGNGVSG